MTFYGTTLNGKTPVMTTELLKGRGVKMINSQPNSILTHNGEIYKNLYNYWLTEKAFIKLKETTTLDRACF